MADGYDRFDNEGGGGSFVMGLLTGTVLGAGLGMLFAPKAGSELRNQISEQAGNIANTASEQYRRATEAAGDWAERGPAAGRQPHAQPRAPARKKKDDWCADIRQSPADNRRNCRGIRDPDQAAAPPRGRAAVVRVARRECACLSAERGPARLGGVGAGGLR